jgi:hypothetical protein
MNRRHKILWNQTADIIQHPMKWVDGCEWW